MAGKGLVATINVPPSGGGGGSTPAPTVGSVTASEIAGARFLDSYGSTHTKITVLPVLQGSPTYPATVNIWLNTADGSGWHNWGAFNLAGSGASVTLGANSLGVSSNPLDNGIWVPTSGDQTWQAACMGGIYMGQDPIATLPTGTQTCSFSMEAVQAVPSTGVGLVLDANGAGSLYDYSGPFPPGYYTWRIHEIALSLPTNFPYLWDVLFTAQEGYVVGGVFTPATTEQGTERQWAALSELLPPGQSIAGELGQTVYVNGPTSAVNGVQVPNWTWPTDTDNWVCRIKAYGASRLGTTATGGTGTQTLLTGWAGNADHFDCIPVQPGQTANLAAASQPTSVTLSETGPRTRYDPDGSTHTVLQAAIQEPVSAPSGESLATILHLQLSSDGQNWGDLGTYQPNRSNPSGGYYTTDVPIPAVLVYSQTQTWYVRTWGATQSNDPGVSSSVESAVLNVPGLGLPLANDIQQLMIAPATDTDLDFPYNTYWSQQKITGFQIPYISWDDTNAFNNDSNAYYVRITAQSLDGTRTPIGPEKPFSGFDVSGAIQTSDPLQGPYGASGEPNYPTTNCIYVRVKCYVCNAIDQTAASFVNPQCATLQTGFTVKPSAVTYITLNSNSVDILIANSTVNGGVPTASIPATQIDPSTLPSIVGSGVGVSGGKVQVNAGNGVTFDSSNNVIIQTLASAGLTFDSSGNLVVNQAALAITNFSGTLDVSRVANLAAIAIGSFAGNLDVSRVNNLTTLAIAGFVGDLDVTRITNLTTLSISSFAGNLDVTRVNNLATLSISSFAGSLDVSRIGNLGSISISSFAGSLDVSRIGNLGSINISSFAGTLNATQCSSINIANFSGTLEATNVNFSGASLAVGSGLTIAGGGLYCLVGIQCYNVINIVGIAGSCGVAINGTPGITKTVTVLDQSSASHTMYINGGIITGYY